MALGSAPGPLGNQSRRFPPIAVAMGPPLRYAGLGPDPNAVPIGVTTPIWRI